MSLEPTNIPAPPTGAIAEAATPSVTVSDGTDFTGADMAALVASAADAEPVPAEPNDGEQTRDSSNPEAAEAKPDNGGKKDGKDQKDTKPDVIRPKRSTKEVAREAVELRDMRRRIAAREAEAENLFAKLAEREREIDARSAASQSELAAAIRDPAKMLDLAAKATGKSHQEVFQSWVRALQTGTTSAPEEAVREATSPIAKQLEETRRELDELRQMFQAQHKERIVSQSKREIVDVLRENADAFPLLDTTEYPEDEIAAAALSVIEHEYKRSKKVLDYQTALGMIHNDLEERERKFQAARSRRANPGQRPESSPATNPRTAAKPPSQTLPAPNGTSAPADLLDLDGDAFVRALVAQL